MARKNFFNFFQNDHHQTVVTVCFEKKITLNSYISFYNSCRPNFRRISHNDKKQSSSWRALNYKMKFSPVLGTRELMEVFEFLWAKKCYLFFPERWLVNKLGARPISAPIHKLDSEKREAKIFQPQTFSHRESFFSRSASIENWNVLFFFCFETRVDFLVRNFTTLETY